MVSLLVSRAGMDLLEDLSPGGLKWLAGFRGVGRAAAAVLMGLGLWRPGYSVNWSDFGAETRNYLFILFVKSYSTYEH